MVWVYSIAMDITSGLEGGRKEEVTQDASDLLNWPGVIYSMIGDTGRFASSFTFSSFDCFAFSVHTPTSSALIDCSLFSLHIYFDLSFSLFLSLATPAVTE